MYLLAPFILQNFKKILRADPELWGCAIFRTKMAHLSWTIFFGTNQTIIITFIYLLTLFIVQNLKNYYSQSRIMRMCHFRAQKWPICHEQNFFGTNHYYYFHLPIGPFHCAKLKKVLTMYLELCRCAIFGPKMVHLPQTIFFWKIINIILIYLLAPFIVQNFKKILPVDPELWGCAIFGPKMAHFPKWEFFSENLLISVVSFIHAYLHSKNQSQILIY